MASRCARLPPTSSSAWLPASATEWIASASIEADPVSANATNLVTAMPVFASSAATTALVPPLVDIAQPGEEMSRASSTSITGMSPRTG